MASLFTKVCNLNNTCIIGDVHSSPSQLKDVLAQAEARGINQFVFLGDLWDRGVDPNGVIDILDELKAAGKLHTLIMGNHCWKFYRYYHQDPTSKHKINMNHEQVVTLNSLKPDVDHRFLKLEEESRIACVVDPINKIFVSHAAGGRPFRLCEKMRNDAASNGSVEEFLDNNMNRTFVLNRNLADRMLYGIVHKDNQVDGQRPVREGITRHPDDDLEGWKYIYGHIHAGTYFPENGNQNSICIDFCCGEPDGQLVAAIFADGKVDFISAAEKT